MIRLADDLLRGAKAIADFTGLEEWEVSYLKKTGALPVFTLPGCRGLFARKSEIDRAFSVRGLRTGLSGGGVTGLELVPADPAHSPPAAAPTAEPLARVAS